MTSGWFCNELARKSLTAKTSRELQQPSNKTFHTPQNRFRLVNQATPGLFESKLCHIYFVPSTLSEHEVPMPVSPLSEAALWRRPRLLMPVAEEEACHAESQPGTHPGEDVLEPRKQTEQGYHGRGGDKQRDVMSNKHMISNCSTI